MRYFYTATLLLPPTLSTRSRYTVYTCFHLQTCNQYDEKETNRFTKMDAHSMVDNVMKKISFMHNKEMLARYMGKRFIYSVKKKKTKSLS